MISSAGILCCFWLDVVSYRFYDLAASDSVKDPVIDIAAVYQSSNWVSKSMQSRFVTRLFVSFSLLIAIAFTGCNLGAPKLPKLAFWKKDDILLSNDDTPAPPASHFDPEPASEMGVAKRSKRANGDDDLKQRVEEILLAAKKEKDAANSPVDPKNGTRSDGEQTKKPIRKPYVFESIDSNTQIAEKSDDNSFEAAASKTRMPDFGERQTVMGNLQNAGKEIANRTSEFAGAVQDTAAQSVADSMSTAKQNLDQAKGQAREMWRNDFQLPANQAANKLNRLTEAINSSAQQTANDFGNQVKSMSNNAVDAVAEKTRNATNDFSRNIDARINQFNSQANRVQANLKNGLSTATNQVQSTLNEAANPLLPQASSSTARVAANPGSAFQPSALGGGSLQPMNNRAGNPSYPTTPFQEFQPKSSSLSGLSPIQSPAAGTTQAKSPSSRLPNLDPTIPTQPGTPGGRQAMQPTSPAQSVANAIPATDSGNQTVTPAKFDDGVVLPPELLHGTSSYAPGSVPPLTPGK